MRVSLAAAGSLTMVVALALAGCTDGDAPDSGDDDGVDEAPAVELTVPAQRLTPFCATMIEVAERLVADPPDDAAGFIIERYESILTEVPTAIRPEFEYVLADLRGDPLPDLPVPDTVATLPPETTDPADGSVPDGTTPETSAPDGTTPPASGPDVSLPTSTERIVDEFLLPDDTPAERLNEFVDFTCRGTANNPGPPPTEPLVEPPSDDDL